MKNLKRTIIALVAVLAMAIPASAQFAWGIKGGIYVNSVDYDKLENNFDSDNRTGWTAGLTAEFTIPIIGLGIDGSLMFVHRLNPELKDDTNLTVSNNNSQDYIEIPINLKYKFSLPIVNRLVEPYLTTGPSFAFLCSKKAVVDAYESNKVDKSWNFGGGVLLFKHLQIGVNYGFGMNKALKYIGQDGEGTGKDLGRSHAWTITGAYFF